MVIHLHEKFYRSNATQLSEFDIKEIRESRGKIPNTSKKIAEKFYINAQHVYEIQNNIERFQQGFILSFFNQLALDKTEQTLKVVLEVSSISLLATEIPKKNGQKKKVKIDEKPITEATSIVEKK